MSKIRVGISTGDHNGIGLEVVLKTFHDSRMLEICTPILYGSSKVINFHKKALHLSDLSINSIKNAEEAKAKKINLVNCWHKEIRVQLGESTEEAGKYAYFSLKTAVEDLASNKIDVLVTAPINKKNIQSEEFNFQGHTEFLADYANEDNPLMIMTGDILRVGMVTGHVPVKEVSSKLSTELIISKAEVFNKSLIQDFGIVKPKIAVLGLNPHAGDNGLLGAEEQEVIIPAIDHLNKNGILAFGPYPSDGFFGAASYKNFDGVLAMYHDQGLIPFKSICFEDGVNFTAGLPIVRTSPDHGTGYDIAGKNIASESSFRHAVYVACDVYKNRKEHRKASNNPLPISKSRKEDKKA